MLKLKSLGLCLCLLFCLASCTDADGARNALSAQGFKDIQITGYQVFGCAKGDKVHTGFIAKGADEEIIKGVVCSGLLFKGSTVRY